MNTPEYTKYIIKLSPGLSTKETAYVLPEILQLIKIPLFGDTQITADVTELTKPTGTVLVCMLRSQYKNEYDELVLVYRFSSIEKY